MRLFVAVEADALAAAASALVAELQSRTAAAYPRARLTWLRPAPSHLTLVFIGELGGEHVGAVRQALEPPLTTQTFRLEVRGLGAFPDRGRPRVLWCGIEAGHDELVRLAAEVAARVRRAGLSIEDRPYRPHLTLARVREDGGLRARRLFSGLEQASLGTAIVDAITLFESRLSPAGSDYRPLLRTALAAPD